MVKKGKFKTVVVSCLITVLLGGAVGLGSSLVLLENKDVLEDGMRMLFDIEQPKSDSGDINSRSREKFNSNSDDEIVPASEREALKTKKGETPKKDVSVSTQGDEKSEFTAEELYNERSDSVVAIKYGKADDGNENIVGSGVLISEDGFIITCEHVVRDSGGDVVVVIDEYDNPDAEPLEYQAKIYGKDQATDLAVLKIERKEAFKFAPIGSSLELRKGQAVVAIGNPMGLYKTITSGIISGLQREIGENNAYMLPSIQTDAPLNPGNSGCPLFDMYGNVIGIVNSKLTYGDQIDNLGFAISIDEAMEIIDQLVEHGGVTSRAALGIEAMEVSPDYGDAVEREGLLVKVIRQGTPAADSELERNDIIIKVDGEDVALVADVQNIIKDKKVGDDVTVTVIRYDRYGDSQEIDITFALCNGAAAPVSDE